MTLNKEIVVNGVTYIYDSENKYAFTVDQLIKARWTFENLVDDGKIGTDKLSQQRQGFLKRLGLNTGS